MNIRKGKKLSILKIGEGGGRHARLCAYMVSGRETVVGLTLCFARLCADTCIGNQLHAGKLYTQHYSGGFPLYLLRLAH